MHLPTVRMIAVAWIVGAFLARVQAEDPAALVAKQKEEAKAHWKDLLGEETVVSQETPHLILFALSPYTEAQLKDVGDMMEKELEVASKTLQIDPKEELWSGKLAVYLVDDRRQFDSFVRGIAKKRVDPDDQGEFSVRGQYPYLLAGPPRSKLDPSLEAQAGLQLASALLSKKGGNDAPDWVSSGFGLATVWRASPTSATTRAQRALVRNMVARKKHTAKDLWTNNVSADEASALQASVMEYLAYGPASKSLLEFVAGFQPDEEGKKKKEKGAAEAFKAVKIDPDHFDRAWQAWVIRGQ